MDDEFKQRILASLDKIERRITLLEQDQSQLRSAYARSRHFLRRRWTRPPMWTFEQYSARPIKLAGLPPAPALPADPPRIAIVTPSYNHARCLDATNLGFAGVDGDIMAYLNSDDVLLPGTLATIAHFFQTRPDIDIVYGHRILIAV